MFGFTLKKLSKYTTKIVPFGLFLLGLSVLLPGSFALAAESEGGIAIHLAPTIIGHLGGVPITNTLMTTWLTMLVLIGLAFLVRSRISLLPGKFQSLVEMLVGTVYDYMANILESKDLAKKYFPLVMTIFLFILLMNWIGLMPGVDSIGFYGSAGHEEASESVSLIPFFHPAATDLNITIAFAIVAFVAIEIAGVLAIGAFKYAGKFLNFHSFLGFAIGLIELISELARLIAFSFRLFGNIFAGKTLLLVIMFLTTPYLVPVPFMAYELFVGFIQAFIFAILTLFFIKLAVTEPH